MSVSSLQIGIIGLPNVGKSTLFNALTGAGIAAENFPFTTIEPNVGVVPLEDERMAVLAEEFPAARLVPAGIRFVDIAGLVEGASRGEGLGNKFLSHIRDVDAVAHVVRFFHNEDVVNVIGETDPLQAMEVIETELLVADLQRAQRALERAAKAAKVGEPKARDKAGRLERIVSSLNAGIPLRRQVDADPEIVKEMQFLTAKPMIYVANVDEGGADPQRLSHLKKSAETEGVPVVVLCAKIEAEIVQLPPDERRSFYEAGGIERPGLPLLARAGQRALGLITFFTAGPKEIRAWLVRRGTKAVEAAGKIHTDFARGFIRAEVVSFADYERHRRLRAVQTAGLMRLEGKDYEVQDGDIIHFRFNG